MINRLITYIYKYYPKLLQVLKDLMYLLTFNRYLYAFFISVIPFLLSLITKPTYNTNDDVAMRMFAEGIIDPTAGASEYLLFINVIYGRFLKFLYMNFQGLPWYDVCFAALLLISFFVIAYCLWKPTANNLYKYVCTAFLGLFFFTCFSQLQFSIVASVMAISGVILALNTAIERPKSLLGYMPITFYIIFSLFMSAQIRFYSMLVMGLFAAVLGLFFLNKKFFTKRFFYICFVMLLGLAISYSGECYNKKVYETNPEANKALEYNFYRSELNDKSYVYRENLKAEDLAERIKTDLNKIGWTTNDYLMINYWNLTGNGFYSIDNMHKLYDAVVKQVQPKLLSANVFENLIKNTFRYALSKKFNFLLIIVLGLVFFNRRYWQSLVPFHLVFCFLLALISVLFREAPFRVYYPLNFLEFSLLLLKAHQLNLLDSVTHFYKDKVRFLINGRKFNYDFKLTYGFIIFCVVSLIIFNNYSKIQKPFLKENKITTTKYKEYMKVPFKADSVYIVAPTPLYFTLLPYNLKTIDWNNKISYGWIIALDVYQKKLANMKLNQDFWLKVCNDKNIYFLEALNPEVLGKMPARTFIKEHYGLNAKYNIVSFPTNDTIIYQYQCDFKN